MRSLTFIFRFLERFFLFFSFLFFSFLFFFFLRHVCFLISWSQRIRGPAFSFDVNGGHKIASDKVAVIVEQIEGDRILQWWEKYG